MSCKRLSECVYGIGCINVKRKSIFSIIQLVRQRSKIDECIHIYMHIKSLDDFTIAVTTSPIKITILYNIQLQGNYSSCNCMTYKCEESTNTNCINRQHSVKINPSLTQQVSTHFRHIFIIYMHTKYIQSPELMQNSLILILESKTFALSHGYRKTGKTTTSLNRCITIG